MHVLTYRTGLRILVVLGLICAGPEVGQSQTVVFKQPAAAPQSTQLVIKMLEFKIQELRNVNAQLASRAKSLEAQVASLKADTVRKPRKTAQYCKRWKHHRCTWLVRR